MKGLTLGLRRPFTGLKLLFSNRTLFLYSLVPILLSTALYVLMAILVYNYYGDLLSLVVKDPDTILRKILYWFVFVFFMIFTLGFFIFSFTVVGSIILAPFSTLIARKVYHIKTDLILPDKKGFIKQNLASFGLELKKMVLVFIPILLFYVIGFFVPVLALVALILGSWAVTYQYMDYIMEEKNLTLGDRVKLLLRHPVNSFMFGFIASFMVSVPILGLICIPSSVAGATVLFTEYEQLPPL